MKLESMSSSRDLGESASVASSQCQHHVQHVQEQYQKAFVVHTKQVYDQLAQELNLTGEQIKLLHQHQAQAKVPVIMEPLNDKDKLKRRLLLTWEIQQHTE